MTFESYAHFIFSRTTSNSLNILYLEIKGGIFLDILLKVGIALGIGLLGGKLAKLVKLPSVTGYLIAGLFVGPAIFGSKALLSSEELKVLDFISELALAFIAFSIGSEFSFEELKKYGKNVFVITVAEALGAVILVFIVAFFIFKQDFALSIVLASMSAATAPAATLLIMRQYRADGPVTKTLLSVVALDDAVGISIFGIAMPLARMSISEEGISIIKMFTEPLIEIFGSLGVGFVIGMLLSLLAKREKDNDDLQVLALVAIIIGVGVADLLDLSPLLTNMTIGMTLVNALKRPEKVFKSVNGFVNPFYVLFFTFAGASLDFKVLTQVGLLGICYVFARGIGKYIGSFLGAASVKAQKEIRNYLGLGLLPQGGVSIGLSILVRSLLPEYAEVITTIIMFSVLIYETSGPLFSKWCISLSKEINGKDKFNPTNENDLNMQSA